MNTHGELLPKQALGRYWIFSKYWWYFCAQSNCLFLAHWCPLVGFLHWQDACSKSSKDLVRYETKFLSWLPVMAKLIIKKIIWLGTILKHLSRAWVSTGAKGAWHPRKFWTVMSGTRWFWQFYYIMLCCTLEFWGLTDDWHPMLQIPNSSPVKYPRCH